MNSRQTVFIQKLEQHLAQEVSLEKMYQWLNEIIIPTLQNKQASRKPGMWLESDAYRMIRGTITDILDSPPAARSDLNWYWDIVSEWLDYLNGRKVYKKTSYWLEYPWESELRKDEQWMLVYLNYVEEVLQILLKENDVELSELNWLPVESAFDNKPLSDRTIPEILMDEILELIKDYQNSLKYIHVAKHFTASELRTFKLERLQRLIKCFRGELFYSVAVVFEGLDRFSIDIMVD